jgi:hypothetical protein
MASWVRFAVLIAVTVANAIAGIIYYRVGVEHLFPMAQGGSSGPFTPAVNQLETLVPIVIAVIQLGVIIWVIVGGVQKERSRVRGPR